MRKVDFLYFDAGGGHRAAANALREVIEQQRRPWQVRLVHLQEVLDPLDVFRKVLRIRLQDLYNLLLRKGWTLGSPQLTRAMQWVIRLYHPASVRLLSRFWTRDPPDLVVSLVPNLNRAVGESLRRTLPRVPFVVVLTDLADYPPHFWIERAVTGSRHYIVCGTARAAEQARELGHPEDRILRTSGMILRPRFYEPLEIDRLSERRKLGLDPVAPTGLVMFGGYGSRVMLEIARRADAQLIVICGRNERLAEALRRLRRQRPMFVEGFTTEVPYYMRLADFFIGKPGPGSISEALAMKLPVIVERNAFTLPQERYNADWIVGNHLGLVVRSFRQVNAAVAEMLRPENYDRFRTRAEALDNRAVYEIPEILARFLESVE